MTDEVPPAGHRRPVVAIERTRFDLEHFVPRARGRASAVIDGQKARVVSEERAQVTVTADPGVVRLGDEGRERAGDDRIDRVPALLECTEPRLDGKRMPGRHHPMSRTNLGTGANHRAEVLRYRHRPLAEYKPGLGPADVKRSLGVRA